ncbi:MAG: hypothetical protein ACJ8MR_18450 [Povalibacter sp.]
MRPATCVFMLIIASASGSLLLAAEPTPSTKPPTKTEQPATPDKKASAEKDAKPAVDKDSKATADKDAKPVSADAAKTGEEKTAADKADGAKPDKSSPQRFIPSEQVRADFDVSFPVDI